MATKIDVLQERRFFDPEFRKRVEALFAGENLVQTILHAHLLLERAITLQLSTKLVRPEVLEEPKYSRWSFHQRLSLYVGLCDPPEDRERMLFGFNQLRNKIAHRFQDEAQCVGECLPWDGELAKPDAMSHVFIVASQLLLELGAVRGFARIDDDEVLPNSTSA